ncbi:FecCD family ABC transporter permease [Williamsia sterculiae]|uniref:Iron complex transport system permease protein n=1 Tax=Williamsia sterculiae TaxID=1344003 RepID=A0A1N7CQ83_9NOCA|nr:iron chelate uptake ABC transporter family permease subunit [Williamsia sterculiae]SIR65743.1 iron complex transport system permease protein [Williamsia sterculiae]
MTARTLVRIGPTSWWLRPRAAVAGVVAIALMLLLFAADVRISDYPLSLLDVGRILLGGGTRVENVVVLDVQLPRALVALLVGAGLAMSGALTQAISRNPLATPDVLGITTGASVGAVFVITLGSSLGIAGTVSTPMGAFIGALGAAFAMYVLAWKNGIEAFRLVLVGIGLAWALSAVVSFLLVRAQLNDAARAQQWIVGSVAQASWSNVWPMVGVLAVALAAMVVGTRQLGIAALGEDVARSLGVRVTTANAWILLLAVALAAVSVAAAGPISFVALLAPPIAMRLTGAATPPPVASALVGACLVLGADLLCRTLLPEGVPVGVVTAGIGGPVLIHLMIRVARRSAI